MPMIGLGPSLWMLEPTGLDMHAFFGPKSNERWRSRKFFPWICGIFPVFKQHSLPPPPSQLASCHAAFLVDFCTINEGNVSHKY